MRLPRIFTHLFGNKLRHESFELCGPEIVHGKGSSPEHRLKFADVTAWQIHPEMVFDIIEIMLADGRRVVWLDKYDDLKSILRRVAPHLERSAN